MKKLLFSIILTFYVSISQAGIIFDGDIFTCDGVTCTPKYGMLLNGAGSAGITVGSSPITSGTNGYLLYNNAGVLGNLNPAGLTLAWSQITGTPTTLSGYGITSPLPINQGGTGQTTANTALNALLPSQTSNSGKVLGTNGTNTSWVTSGSSAFTSRGAGFISGGQSLPNGQTVIPFDSITPGFGSTSEFDITTHPGRFTSTAGGIYLLTARCLESGFQAAFNEDFALVVYKNSAQYDAGPIIYGTNDASFQPYTGISTSIWLAAGDYVEVYQLNNTVSLHTFTVVGSQLQTWIQIVQIQ